MIESSIKCVGPDRVIDHGHLSSIIEYSRLSLTVLKHDRFCIYYVGNIHSIWITSIYTCVITRTEYLYPLLHLGILVVCG